jgi:hypothetical protein
MFKRFNSDPGSAERPVASAAAIKRNFMMMTVWFAINHACVMTVLGYAAADFKKYGNTSTAALYGAYCITSLFFSGIVIASIGTKWGLVCGLTHYTAYLLTAYLATITGNGYLFIAGAAFGGMGSGYLWVCQGSYFTESAQAFANVSACSLERATGMLASKFATVYLVSEVGVKFLGSAIKQAVPGKAGSELMYLVFMVAGIISCVGMARIDDLRPSGQRVRTKLSYDLLFAQSSGAFRLLWRNPKMGLLIPTQLAFAVVAAFLGAWITPQVLGKAIGNDVIGYFLGIIAAVAALTSFAAGHFIKHTNEQWPMMVLGAAAFACVVIPFALEADPAHYDVWKVVLVYAAQGAGRGIYESTNKAVVAEFFVDDAPSAFANILWTNGLASAICYAVFPSMGAAHPSRVAFVCLSTVALGVGGYLCALSLQQRELRGVSAPSIRSSRGFDGFVGQVDSTASQKAELETHRVDGGDRSGGPARAKEKEGRRAEAGDEAGAAREEGEMPGGRGTTGWVQAL